MKINFIKHSCFLLEMENCNILFDYYEGDLPPVPTGKKLLVFASHSHYDHFSTKLFDAVKNFEDVSFILSDDIDKNLLPEKFIKNTVFVAPNKEISFAGCEIKTLRSTDAGVAFLIKIEGKTLYHAGDLHCWVWDVSSNYEQNLMKKEYTNEIIKIADEAVDLAFVPLDPRLEGQFAVGMHIFLNKVKVKNVVPMHMWGNFEAVPVFLRLYPQYNDVLVPIKENGQTVIIQ